MFKATVLQPINQYYESQSASSTNLLPTFGQKNANAVALTEAPLGSRQKAANAVPLKEALLGSQKNANAVPPSTTKRYLEFLIDWEVL